MTFTRKSIADHLDAYDDQIAELQDAKREMLNDYRAQLAEKGFGKAAIKAEIDGLKVAMRRRRAIAKKGEEEVDQADAIADEIFIEITASTRAPRATREIIEEFPLASQSYSDAKGVDRDARRKQRLSESMDDAKALSAEAVALGLIDPAAHAETERIANALANKLGAGVVGPETGELTGKQNSQGGNGPLIAVEAATEKQTACVSQPINPHSQALPSKPADTAEAPTSSPETSATNSPDPQAPPVDGGRPYPSPNAAGAKSGGPTPIAGRGAHQGGFISGEFGQQDAGAAQARNEPGSVSGATANHSDPYDPGDIPEFLRRSDGYPKREAVEAD